MILDPKERPIFETPFGRLRMMYEEDGYYDQGRIFKYELKCPGCGEWGLIDQDQLQGSVSVDHAAEGCVGGYHETHDFGSALEDSEVATVRREVSDEEMEALERQADALGLLEQPALSEAKRLRQQSKEEYEHASRLASQGMSGDEAHARSDLLREQAKRLEANGADRASIRARVHAVIAAWSDQPQCDKLAPHEVDELAGAVASALKVSPAPSEGVGSGAEARAVLCGLREQAVRHRRKEQEVRDAEKADRESGKLPTGSSYEATWNYHQGLWKAYEDAAERLRRVLPAPPPQAVQGEEAVKCECCEKLLPSECAGFGVEGEAFCGHCMQALDAPLVKAAKDLVDDLTGPLLELHKARVAPLRDLLNEEYSFDRQPEKGGEG